MIVASILIGMTLLLCLKLPSNSRVSYVVCVGTHFFIAVINVALGGQLIGANADAQRFFRLAVEGSTQATWKLIDLTNGVQGFLNIHSVVQYYGGPSFFLAHAVSLLGVGITLLCLAGLWKECGGNKEWLPKIFFFYTCIPSILLFQSYILREVWQAACILAVARIVLRMQQRGLNVAALGQLLLFFVVGSLTHKAMPFMMLVEVLAIFFGYSWSSKRFTSWSTNAFIGLGVFAIFGLLMSTSHLLTENNGESLQYKAQNYAQGVSALAARSNYGAHFEASYPWTLIPTLFSYQLEPLPWRVRTLADLIPLIENSIRLWLLYLFWFYRKRAENRFAAPATALLFAWLGVETIWSVGTVNWGTAVRHHTAAYGLLLVTAMIAKQGYKHASNCARIKTQNLKNRIAA